MMEGRVQALGIARRNGSAAIKGTSEELDANKLHTDYDMSVKEKVMKMKTTNCMSAVTHCRYQ